MSRCNRFLLAGLFSIALLPISLSSSGASIKAAESEPPVATYVPVASAGGRVIEIVPDESRSLAWIVQGTRVFAVTVSAQAGLREIGSGLQFSEIIRSLAIEGTRGLAIDISGRADWLDLSEPGAPRTIREMALDSLGRILGPAVLVDNLAYIAHDNDIALIDLETGDRLLDHLIGEVDSRVIAITRLQNHLAIATRPRSDWEAPARLRIYPLRPQPGLPRFGLEELGSMVDPAIGELLAVQVDGEERLYAFRDDDREGYRILALSLDDPAFPTIVKHWEQGGSDMAEYSGMAVGDAGDIFLRRYVLHYAPDEFSLGSQNSIPSQASSPQHQFNEYHLIRIAAGADAKSWSASATGRPYDSFPRVLAGHLLIGNADGLSLLKTEGDEPNPIQLPAAVKVNQIAAAETGDLTESGFLFAGNDGGGLVSLSLVDPLRPAALDFVSNSLRYKGLTAEGDRLVYTGHHGGSSPLGQSTRIIDITDPRNLRPGAFLNPSFSHLDPRLAQAGRRLVTGQAYPPRVLLNDLSDPDQVRVLSSIPFERDVLLDFATDGRRVLALHRGSTNRANGLVSLMLSLYWIEGLGPKAHLRLRAVQRIAADLASYPEPRIVLQDGIAWMTFAQGCSASAPRLLVGYDLGNPGRPRALSWLTLPEQQAAINEPVIADGHLFIPGSPVLVVDVRQPESPRPVARLIPGGPALAVHQGLAYVADDYSGIHIYRPDLAWAGDPSKPRPTPPRPTPQALPSPTFDCRPTERPSATPTPPTPTPTNRPSSTPYAWPTRRPSPTPTAADTGAGIATGRAFLPVMVREAR